MRHELQLLLQLFNFRLDETKKRALTCTIFKSSSSGILLSMGIHFLCMCRYQKKKTSSFALQKDTTKDLKAKVANFTLLTSTLVTDMEKVLESHNLWLQYADDFISVSEGSALDSDPHGVVCIGGLGCKLISSASLTRNEETFPATKEIMAKDLLPLQ